MVKVSIRDRFSAEPASYLEHVATCRNESGGKVKIVKTIGQAITNPLGAAVVCVVGGYVIWFAFAPPPGGAVKLKVNGRQVTSQRSGKVGRSDQVERRNSAASRADDRTPPRNKQGALAANKRKDGLQGTAIGGNETHFEEFEATSERGDDSAESAGTDMSEPRPAMTAAKTTAVPALEVIGPRDPRASSLTEYQTKKAQFAVTAMDQKRLALWCDERGLWDLAKTHWEASLRLDPKSDEARRRLGIRLKGGSWVVDAASAEDAAQRKANAFWKKLEVYHSRMKCRSKVAVPGRDEAVETVESVGDPRAASAIWKVFAADVSHHALIVGILSRFKTREACANAGCPGRL